MRVRARRQARHAHIPQQGAAIDGTEDATTEELAAEVAASLSGMSGRVVVLRGEKRHGWVDVADGAVANWSAL